MKIDTNELRFSDRLRDQLNSRFADLEIVAKGASSLVAKANDRLLGRLVALKIFLDRSNPNVAENADREARILSSLNHPGVIRLLDKLSVDHERILVFPYFARRTVDSYLQAEKLNDAKKILLLQRAMASLHFIHSRDLIHGDIKPENLLVHDNDFPVWCDLGCVVPRLRTEGGADSFVGSVGYIAPEVALQLASVTVSSDIFSLGVTIYEILSEKRAFPGAMIAEHSSKRGRPDQLLLPPLNPREIPNAHDWNLVLQKATCNDPKERYGSVLDFWEDIDLIRSNRPIKAIKPSWISRLRKWSSREKALTRIIVIAVTSMLGITLIAMFSWSNFDLERVRTLALQKGLDAQVEKSKSTQVRLAKLLSEADSSLKLAQQAEADENSIADELKKNKEVLKASLDESNSLLKEIGVLEVQQGKKYFEVVGEKWNASQRFLTVVPEIQVEILNRTESSSKKTRFDPKELDSQRVVPTRIYENGQYVFQSFFRNGFRLVVHEPELVFSYDRLEDAMENLRLESSNEKSRFTELGLEWKATNTAIKKMVTTQPFNKHRLQVGRIYEIGVDADYLRFRVSSINGKTPIPVPVSLSLLFEKFGFQPDRVVLLQTLSNELEADVFGGEMPIAVAHALHQVVKKATYENVTFTGSLASKEETRVKELRLIQCDFAESTSDAGVLGNQSFGPLGRLELLTLSRCRRLPRGFMQDGKNYPMLANVRVIQTELLDEHLESFASAPQLTTFWINNNGITNQQVGIISRSTTIEILAISGCKKVTSDAYNDIAEMPSLMELELAGNSMRKGDVSSLGKLKSLFRLGLHDNSLENSQLHGLANLDSLVAIALTGNHQISDGILDSLKKCSQLRDITIDGTNVSNRFLEAMDGFPNLKQFNVDGTGIGKDALEVFRKKHPRIQVTANRLSKSGLTPSDSPPLPFERYEYPGGYFDQLGNQVPKLWMEYKSNHQLAFQFEEKGRTETDITLFDNTRNFTIQIPIHGGMAKLSANGEKSWSNFSAVVKALTIDRRTEANFLRPLDSKSGWKLNTMAGATATIVKEGEDLVLNTTRIGNEDWHVQVFSSPLRLEEGRGYQVKFIAKSPTETRVDLIASQAGGKYANVGLQKRIALTPEYREYHFVFVLNGQGQEKTRLGLHAGVDPGTVQIQSIVLLPL